MTLGEIQQRVARRRYLAYDYEEAALLLTMTNELTPWKAVDVEIETRDGQRVSGHHVSCQERRLVLLENTLLREKDVVQITFKAEHLYA